MPCACSIRRLTNCGRRRNVLALPKITPGVDQQKKDLSQELYQKIIFLGFDWQREGIVEQLAHQEDEEVRQLTDQAMPKLPAKEMDKIVANLTKEMDLMSGRQEFERAAQLRDRIKELRSYESR